MPLIHPALLHTAVAPALTRTAARGGTGSDGGAGALLVPDRYLGDEPSELDLPDLRALVARLAASEAAWRPLVRHDPHRRWYTRLVLSGVVEVWLIGWYPGQQTQVHDHGGALGALAVADGVVDEDEYGPDWRITRTHRHGTGTVPGFGRDHVHRVVNRGSVPATTIHAYSPPELPLRYAPGTGREAVARQVPAAAAASIPVAAAAASASA